MRRISAFIFMVVLLFGCGGGSLVQDVQTIRDYSRPAYQSPNYHPHEGLSYIHTLNDTTYIGGDVSPRETLRRIGTHVSGITLSMGASRDGVGVDRIQNYANDLVTQDGSVQTSSDGFYPFRVQPKIWYEAGFWDLLLEDDETAGGLYGILHFVRRILNDALPPEFQIGTSFEGSSDIEGTIAVIFRSPERVAELCNGGAACALSDISYIDNSTRTATVVLPDNLNALDSTAANTLVVHELLHALGVQGHIDSIEFPDSIMGKYGDFFPNPGFTIHRIDREVLQIMYMSQRTDVYNDWGGMVRYDPASGRPIRRRPCQLRRSAV